MEIAPKPEKEAERIKAIQELGILDTPISPIFERITRITKQIFDVPIVAISIIDTERQWFKSTQGMNVCQNDLNSSFCAHAILQNDIFIIPDSLNDKRFADNPCVTSEPFVRFYAGCPIGTEDGYNLGTLCIIDSKPREFTDQQLQSLKDMAALAQDELQKYHQKHTQLEVIKELDIAKRAKLLDSLTGVWNRAGSELNLQEHIALAKQNNYSLIVGIYDIDDFKHVNDTYGHSVGDCVIREICKSIVLNLHEDDVVGRWGGEEFVIIAKVNDKIDNVLERVNLAQSAISSEAMNIDDKKIDVSITMGIAIVNPEDQISSKDVINRADTALYQGKRTGKNKTILFSEI